MPDRKRQEDATLIDVLVDGFEKNEILWGFRWRELPMPDEDSAMRKVDALCDEARRWKGIPLRTEDVSARRLMAWPDLELRQAGRGVMVLVKAPWFDAWWHEPATWAGDPMQPIFDWLAEEAAASKGGSR